MSPTAPMAPDPTLPPQWFLFALFFVGMAFVFAYLFVEAALRERKRRRMERIDVVARCCKQFWDTYDRYERETLINQSPGGRKPWQT